jgi:hypothetical protein
MDQVQIIESYRIKSRIGSKKVAEAKDDSPLEGNRYG